MSFAFDLSARPSAAWRRAVSAAHLTGACGAMALAGPLAAASHPALAALCTAALEAAVVLSWRRSGRQAARGRLAVDDDGRARWLAQGGAPQARATVLLVKRWCRVGDLVWIDAHAGAGRLRLLLGRDSVGDPAWRALLCWLRWLQRGGHEGALLPPLLQSPPAAPR